MSTIESILSKSGISSIAGVDEAGRGACAGPLVVAAVILKTSLSSDLARLQDSKALSEKARERFFDIILKEAIAISTIEISSSIIDERGVHVANLDGMRRAVHGLTPIPEYVLTDGYPISGLGIPSLGVWKGDQVVHSISAASIVAKVTRDRIMDQLDKLHFGYGFSSHKGYSTAAHLQAVKNLGALEIHRRSFSNIAALINTQL